MERDPVGAEGDDGVRADCVDELPDEGPAAIVVAVEGAVGKTEEAMVGDAEDGHRCGRLPAPQATEALRRPGVGVGRAVLTCCRRHADDALPVVASGGHHARGEVALVVGVRPDRQDGAELGDGVVRRDRVRPHRIITNPSEKRTLS